MRGTLTTALRAREAKRSLVVPEDNAKEGLLADGATILPAPNPCGHLQGSVLLQPAVAEQPAAGATGESDLAEIRAQHHAIGQAEVEIDLCYLPNSAELMAGKQREFTPALPFCQIKLRAEKPTAYPLVTLGNHIRKARIERQLDQGNVAAILQVSVHTLSKWETGKSQPLVKYWPAIMNFLGYCPYEQAKSLGHRLRLHRTHRGLSHRDLAGILGVDPGSISRWETGDRRLDKRSRAVIGRFLGDGDFGGR